MKNLFRFLIAQLSFFYKNKKINKKFETKVIKEKGQLRIEYVNRLVKGDTVEIVKDMSEEEKQKFLAKQKELFSCVLSRLKRKPSRFLNTPELEINGIQPATRDSRIEIQSVSPIQSVIYK